MAAKPKEFPFYVYELISPNGAVAYVGKGSGRRLSTQKGNFKLDGHEVARFKREKDAYAFEVERIAEVSPLLNKCKGGNGSKVQKRRETVPAWVREIEGAGTRVYAARLLLQFANGIKGLGSKVDVDFAAVKEVAYGFRA